MFYETSEEVEDCDHSAEENTENEGENSNKGEPKTPVKYHYLRYPNGSVGVRLATGQKRRSSQPTSQIYLLYRASNAQTKFYLLTTLF